MIALSIAFVVGFILGVGSLAGLLWLITRGAKT